MTGRLRGAALSAAFLIATSGNAAPARADAGGPAAAAPAGYPFAVHLRLSRETLREVVRHAPGPTFFTPQNPSCVVPVGRQADAAYAAAVGRTFRPAAGAAAGELEVAIAAAGFTDREGEWYATVEHAVVLRALPGGAELARWRLRGDAHVAGLGERAIPAAFERAADEAARRLEAELATPPAVTRWIEANGGRVVTREAPVRAAGAEPRRTPPRSLSFAADAGGAAITALDTSSGALALRAALSDGRGFAQLGVEGWAASVPLDPYRSERQRVDLVALGLDVGATVAFARSADFAGRLHLGLGGRVLRARATYEVTLYSRASTTAYAVAPTAFLVLQGTREKRWGAWRYGLELRRYFLGTLDLYGYRPAQLAEYLVGVFVGIEGRRGAAPAARTPPTGP